MSEENVFADKKPDRLPKVEPTLLQRGENTLFQLKSPAQNHYKPLQLLKAVVSGPMTYVRAH
jgi:hypothetical protein